MEDNRKKWFVTKKNEIRYLYMVIRTKDDTGEMLSVTMDNSYNSPDTINTRIEWVNEHNLLETVKDCQFEIIRRERFAPKG